MQKKYITILLAACAALNSGCATMYPPVLNDDSVLSEDSAVILMAVEGQAALNYVQICSANISCSNFYFPETTNDVIAFSMKVPVNGMNIASYTVAGRGAGYIGSSPFGYRTVNAEDVAITDTGVFFYGTLNTDTGAFDQNVDNGKLSFAYQKYANLLSGKTAINFTPLTNR